jgi:putative addiction module component (TIGR02574 family)
LSDEKKTSGALRGGFDPFGDDRAELAGLLMHTLALGRDEEIEKAWEEEIDRRVRAMDAGEMATIPWEDVRADLLARRHEES